MDQRKWVKFGKIMLTTGKYEGELMDGLPNGKGSLTYRDPPHKNWVYRGDWADGFECGYGVLMDDKKKDR